MKIGKISEQTLKRSVFRQIKTKRNEVLQGAGVGEDCAVLKLAPGEVFVCSIDPITAAAKDAASLAIHVTANDIATSGAQPVAVLLSILLPVTMEEPQLREMMQELEETCAALNIQIAGGHTETTAAVNQPVITVSGIGKALESEVLPTGGVKPGQDLILTKWIALEGTSIIAKEKEEELKKRFPMAMIDTAKGFDRYISVVPEAAAASRFGVSAMHDVTEGGIFGALWELAESAGVGLEADLKKIPVKQESIEICEYFGLNPYVMMSSGALLIAADDGLGLIAELGKCRIPASLIGRTTDGNDRVLFNGEDSRFLERPQPDEIYKLL